MKILSVARSEGKKKRRKVEIQRKERTAAESSTLLLQLLRLLVLVCIEDADAAALIKRHVDLHISFVGDTLQITR